VRRYVAGIIARDYDFMTAGSGHEALQKMKRYSPDLILCDIMMPEIDGYAFLRCVKQEQLLRHIPFVFLTARADMEMRIEGLDEGADDYIVKPFNARELLARIRSLLRMRQLLGENAAQKRTIASLNQKLEGKYSYGTLVGNSPAMRKLYQLLEAVRDSETPVLITGETGTGKELIANAIHYNSPRKGGALISVNCGAIPRELMERECFGHVKGAYTGATETRRGYFQEADGGTLFLDEIGELHRDMQVKLLRVLERGEVTRVGDAIPRKISVRLIAATNKDLLEEVRKGNFREDLFYRIYVVPLHVPPLRERRDDIPLLIEHFVKQLSSKLKKKLMPMSEADMRCFMNYDYPGNVRELEHLVERLYLLGGGAQNLFLTSAAVSRASSDLPYEELLASSNPLKMVGQKARARAERDLIAHVLQSCGNNYAEAAQMLGIGLSSLYRKIKEND